MYAAPLNFDRFFKKVFSNVNIAKKFLEDFLDVEIEEIKLIPVKHKLTDAAAIVEFDFRCKIKGQYIIVDMQQAYKQDVVKRFYVYHVLNTGMQLETLPKKIITSVLGKKYEVKSYEGMEPVITLVWMADDTFNLDLETLVFALTPEQTIDFIKNDTYWESKDVEKVCKIREELLALLNDDTKELGFLSQNKLIYAFQKNIIKSSKFHKYKEWFDFAETTQNPKNTKNDFEKFKKNKTLMEVLERIKTDTLNEEELTLLDEWESDFIQLAEYREYLYGPFKEEMAQKHLKDLRQQAVREVREEIAEEVREEVRQDLEKEVRQDLEKEVRQDLEKEVRQEIENELEEKIVLAYKKGLDIDLISDIFKLSLEKITEIIEKHKEI